MNRICLAIRATAVCFIGLTLLSPASAKSASETEKELKRLHDEWAQARVRGDTAFLENFYGKELRLNVMNGSVVNRDFDIAAFASRTMKPELVEDEDLKISVYGKTAIATGVEHVKGTYRGNAGEFRLRFINVLVRRNGRWQLVAHQSTEVRNK